MMDISERAAKFGKGRFDYFELQAAGAIGWQAGFEATIADAAAVARERHKHHATHCPSTCKCADGFHIAAAIEALVTPAASPSPPGTD